MKMLKLIDNQNWSVLIWNKDIKSGTQGRDKQAASPALFGDTTTWQGPVKTANGVRSSTRESGAGLAEPAWTTS